MDNASFSKEMPYFGVLTVVLLCIVLGGVFLLISGSLPFYKPQPTEENGNGNKTKGGAPKKKPQKKRKEKDVQISPTAFTHSWLCCVLKGHSGVVYGLDFSQNGKFMITCSEDRSVLIWNTDDFMNKDHKFVKGNVEFDCGTLIRFSPDNKAFILGLAQENTVRVFKIGKKDSGGIGNVSAVSDFPKHHVQSLMCVGVASVASGGRFIVTAAENETTIVVWDLKGNILTTFDTNQLTNSHVKVSTCGRYIASSGFTPDVRIWEVCFDKSGQFTSVEKAFVLKGHTAGVYAADFSSDSNRMVAVSKDGTWRLWDTDIDYRKNQEPYLLQTTNYTAELPAAGAGAGAADVPCRIALAPDGLSVAVARQSTVALYSALDDGAVARVVFASVHQADISALQFSVDCLYLATSGDRHVRVFHNVTGLRAKIRDLDEKMQKSQSKIIRQRIKDQVTEVRSRLVSILGASGDSE